MQIGTTGSAYGPGFAVSRPTLGGGRALPPGGRRIVPLRMPMTPTAFSPMIHHNELVNRMVALRIAQHPALAGTAQQSPLMQAHAALPSALQRPLPPPLTQMPQIDMSDSSPIPTTPMPLPVPPTNVDADGNIVMGPPRAAFVPPTPRALSPGAVADLMRRVQLAKGARPGRARAE